MKKTGSFFTLSLAELKNIRSLVFSSLLTAIFAVSYSPVAGNLVLVPRVVEIRFGFVAVALAAMLYGPVMAGLVAVIGDLLGTIWFYGGPFFIGYTVNWMLMGIAFGLILYKNRYSMPRIILAVLFRQLVVGLLFTSLLHSMLGIGTFQSLLITRIPLQLIMIPVNILLLTFVLRGVAGVFRKLEHTAGS